ncbi:T9SS type A sorting domain-containing protein [Wocania ichthyoenteri]|uniref:T9SS type A sorting domain-containing protein n=1 Tax=Wocania ichthyoenteri TaxID=1230531 RepID=UPI00053F0109|nr:T9SS type A sorting domain-containing protein [Wocania ichthyoenteri]
MKKIIFLIVSLFYVLVIAAQSGDTINDAIVIDGNNVALNILDYNSATQSGLTPSCGSTEDIFYMHAVSTGDNKITIGMTSSSVIIAASVEYQILLAPNGDTNNLQLVTCSSYSVPLIIGGSFEQVIENVTDTDVYYLRVYKPTGLGVELTNLLNGTSITMMSEFDASLSTRDTIKDKIKIIVNEDEIKLYGSKHNAYEVYSLDGKRIVSNTYREQINLINVSQLNKGLFVLVLTNKTSRNVYKFVKK